MGAYIGNTEIGQMFLGSTEIGQAYLGSTKVWEKGGVTPPQPSLPYDAEIGYLQGDGNAYIDLGVKGNLNTAIDVICETPASGSYECIAGSRSGNSNAITIIYGHNQPNTWRFGGKSTSIALSDGTSYTISVDKSRVLVNGVLYSLGQTSSFTTDSNIQVFFAGSISLNKFTGKIYGLKLENETITMNLIPVRVGTTGYMYDKVSGQLFGNNGTGNFTLGNDITT